jgi:O-methyltransferase
MIFKALHVFRKALFSRDPLKQYEARFSLLNSIANRLNFRLYNRNLLWLEDDEYKNIWRQFPEATPEIKDRKFALYSMAKSLANLPGDSAECGVYNGGSSFLICAAMQGKVDYFHHAFDSFEGLSTPEAGDKTSDNRAYKWQEHDLSIPIETVQKNLSQFDFVRYYKGWIPSRFMDISDRQFAFVHIDVDLYQPTYDSVAFFYERMVKGGIIMCDDYGFTTCPGATRAMNEFLADKPEKSVIHLPTGQGFIVKH